MAPKLISLLSLLIIVLSAASTHKLKLKQVVVLGRHNVRTPLTTNLEKISPKVWPKWTAEVGFLTEKGALLETYIGEYFSLWLKKEGLFNGCPKKDSVYIYANVKQRTRESARMFTESAFKHCNFTVNFISNVKTDPVFHPALFNDTESFKKVVSKEMQTKLKELHLEDAYSFLNDVLEFNASSLCKETNFCDLLTMKDELLLMYGEEPDIYGPLNVGNSAVDAFLMSYYNGAPIQDIAWGRMQADLWEVLTKVTKENQNVRFNNTILSRHIAKPLLKVLYEVMTDDNLKFTLLVGHDSNLNSVLSAIGFKSFELDDQYEKTPVGGKLVFQKWYDEESDKYLVKIAFVYQSTEQLREGTKLSLENPPKSVNLEPLNCKTDIVGFCDWEDFLNDLKLLQSNN